MIGIVGTGRWGQNLAQAFSKLVGEEKVLVWDTSSTALAAIKASLPKITIAASLDEMASPQVTAVAIATPVVTHAEMTRWALERGKHAFVEKPLAMSVAEATALAELADRRGLTLMVDQILLYHPATRHLKAVIDQDQLGKVLYIHSQRLNLGTVRRQENVLWSFGPHDVGVLLYLMGRSPSSVSCYGGAYLQPGIEDMAVLVLRFPSGERAYIHVSWLDPVKTRRLTVVGRKAMAVLEDTGPGEARVTLYHRGVEESTFSPYDRGTATESFPNADPLSRACSHFLQCADKGLRPLTDGWWDVQVISVLETAQHYLAPVRPSLEKAIPYHHEGTAYGEAG